MMMRATTMLLVSGLVLTACGENDRRVRFDGELFRAKVERNRDDRAALDIRVRDAAKSLAGAREAGRYEGVKYCIKTFGTSEILWDRGPDAEDGELLISDGDLMLRGRCKGW